jgi:hypothetical protein
MLSISSSKRLDLKCVIRVNNYQETNHYMYSRVAFRHVITKLDIYECISTKLSSFICRMSMTPSQMKFLFQKFYFFRLCFNQ